MKFAIIDDSSYKIDSLFGILSRKFPESPIEIAKTFQSAMKMLGDYQPDVVLLDMSLPTSEKEDGRIGGRGRIYGGRELMAEMEFMEIAPQVIIVSQFEAFREDGVSVDLAVLLKELEQDFPALYVGGVFYSTVDNTWEGKLDTLLHRITE
jgi:hypothetical protein